MSGVKSDVFYYPGGYGYRIEPGDRADRVKQLGEAFINKYQNDLQWVVSEFGGWDASGLEVASTMLYSDREALRKAEHLDLHQLSKRVRELKPRYGLNQIEGYAQQLREKDLLKSVQ